ncbi:response regulator [Flavihumibacter stibioxidans]|uniref:LuxR family two component transcriptional regulator n=1 Tax=Flavihumibacter stibioxidans TaxID=1834163 RepID=A0ABR7M488_9BACT|nr:response regulator transcription factor [Flavihumibacter stibioxidans]MBC6489550.1 hypothetical protein [Flavihumibacter stibioxidans]
MTSILIVDDHPLVGDGVSTMIRDVEWLEICGVCKTAKQAMETIQAMRPDLILLDISLPDSDGLQTCEQIRKQDRQVKIIALTSTNEAGIISQFLARGGNGYLLKNMERQELLDAIGDVMNGKIFLSKAANQKILEQYNSVAAAVNKTPMLTRREKEILQLLYEGLTGPQIAEKLFVSPYTIETHRKNLLQKFNVSTTQALLRISKEQKLI